MTKTEVKQAMLEVLNEREIQAHEMREHCPTPFSLALYSSCFSILCSQLDSLPRRGKK
jgi:hypothetical protein